MKKEVKILFVLMDGIGDYQTKEMENKTTLEKSNIPIMDTIANTGINGIMDPVETGLSCGSDTAHMNIFGYNPFKYYRGRGSYETMGAGLDMSPGEIGFKCNFAHLDNETQNVKKRRVDRNFEKWGLPLIESIDKMQIKGFEPYYIRAKHATEHRCGVKITGGDELSSNITGTDPLKDNLKLRKVVAKSQQKNDIFTAKLINSLSDQIHDHLEKHPLNEKRKEEKQLTGNIVLLRGCGERINVKPFNDLHKLKGFMIAPTAIIKGLGMSIGMHTPHVPGATGDYHSDYSKKLSAAINLFENDGFNFGFIHIKSVDDAGHDKNGQKKIESIEKVDAMLNELVNKYDDLKNEYIICITGDHTTPYQLGDHTFEPVPVAISSLQAVKFELSKKLQKKCSFFDKSKGIFDKVSQYDEKNCGKGVLGRFPASELMGVLKNSRNQFQNSLDATEN